MNRPRIGLVLSGGGAKGAYHAGVVKALAEMGTAVDAVAGASIGALNGAVLASAPSLADGAARLEELWNTLASEPPLRHNMPAYLKLALAGGLALAPGRFDIRLEELARQSGLPLPGWLQDCMSDGLLSSGPLHDLMNRYLDPKALHHGLPLYISVFESMGGGADLLEAVAAGIGLRDSRPSTFFHVQSLAPDQQRSALLASAAIPVLFTGHQIAGKTYTDGGLGGWMTSQGNTPITPLLEAGFRDIIVTHLSDGSLWSRHDFPDANIIEIRPQVPIARDGSQSDLLGFDQRRIPSWIAQGYTDAMACLQRVAGATAARGALKESEQLLAAEKATLPALDASLDDVLARLRRQ